MIALSTPSMTMIRQKESKAQIPNFIEHQTQPKGLQKDAVSFGSEKENVSISKKLNAIHQDVKAANNNASSASSNAGMAYLLALVTFVFGSCSQMYSRPSCPTPDLRPLETKIEQLEQKIDAQNQQTSDSFISPDSTQLPYQSTP